MDKGIQGTCRKRIIREIPDKFRDDNGIVSIELVDGQTLFCAKLV